MALREQFTETVTAPLGVNGELVPLENVATTVYDVNPDGSEGSAASAYAGRTGATPASSLLTNASGTVSYWLDPGEYNVHFDDQQIPPRIASYIRGFVSLSFSQGQLIASNQGLPVGIVSSYTGITDPVDPDGITRWLIMNGRAISRSSHPAYSALLSAQGYPFGAGDGSSTFNIPHASDLAIVGAGGLYAIGATGGAATVTLANNQMPIHSHGGLTGGGSTGDDSPDHVHAELNPPVNPGGAGWSALAGVSASGSGFPVVPSNNNYAGGVEGSTAGANVRHAHAVPALAINNDGGGLAHNNLQPYLALYYIVKVL